MKQPKNELITIIDTAYAASDAKQKYGMKIGDHKLICSVLDAHLTVTEQRVTDINERFREKMYEDVTQIIKEQWPNALREGLKDYSKARDRKILNWLILTAIITLILSVSVGLLLNIWYHNHYLILPLSNAVSAITSLF